MKLIIVALALLFIANSIPGAAAARVQINGMVLVEQWPLSFCSNPKNHRCKDSLIPKDRFTIHGLWPLRQADGKPADGTEGHDNCGSNNNFDKSQLFQIRRDLDVSWPSVLGDNMQLWAGQWNKHGRCSSFRRDQQEDYFKAALALHKKLGNLVKRLREGTGLTRGGSVPIASIQEWLSEGADRRGVLKCSQAGDGTGRWMLEEIRWCIDTKALRFRNCPALVGDSGCSKVNDLHLPDQLLRSISNHSSLIPVPLLEDKQYASM